MFTARRVRTILVVLCIALVAVVAWRWWPRPGTPVGAAMRTAARTLLANVGVRAASPPAPPARPGTQREHLIAGAYTLQGVPYIFGAKGPDALDCSGFTKRAYEKIGVRLPDGSFNQAKGELPLSSADDMRPGDLIFYRWSPDAGVKHVTMYAGSGWVIGTGSPGQPREVTVYPLADDLIDDGRIITYRHVVLPDER